MNVADASAITLSHVGKKYRKPSQALTTTLKTYLIRDFWRDRKGGERQNNLWALEDVSLHLRRGCTTGVIGRNGSGKSTLLKLMGRILGPDRGTISIDGRVAALIELGAGFHPELTGRENALINGVIMGLNRQEVRERMPDIIAFADVGEFIDYPVRTYSSGMYARLAFAVAMHVDPDILLIDEVLAVGDAAFSAKCRTALQKFQTAGKSIVLVSHDLDTVQSWCDHVVWLDGGRVRAEGPPNEVVRAYRQQAA